MDLDNNCAKMCVILCDEPKGIYQSSAEIKPGIPFGEVHSF